MVPGMAEDHVGAGSVAVRPVTGADTAAALARLSQSRFRAQFELSAKDREYALCRGRAEIAQHALELIRARVGAAEPLHDGKQTPFRGHPVFTAQHATATCCRGCIQRWHGIPMGRALDEADLERLAALVMAWLDQRLRGK